MSSFNFFGTTPACANPELLNDVLRGEWGFVGMVDTDFFGGYGYMNAERAIANGNDMMLGLGTSEYATVKNTSATMVRNMRGASKNILYTTGNHGAYVHEVEDTGMATWEKIFITVDVILIVLIIALMALILIRWSYSIVNTYFMPNGVECDKYSIMGEILSYRQAVNRYTKEMLYVLHLSCNNVDMEVTISERDLMGEPEIGRRFKGKIWMQGRVTPLI